MALRVRRNHGAYQQNGIFDAIRRLGGGELMATRLRVARYEGKVRGSWPRSVDAMTRWTVGVIAGALWPAQSSSTICTSDLHPSDDWNFIMQLSGLMTVSSDWALSLGIRDTTYRRAKRTRPLRMQVFGWAKCSSNRPNATSYVYSACRSASLRSWITSVSVATQGKVDARYAAMVHGQRPRDAAGFAMRTSKLSPLQLDARSEIRSRSQFQSRA